MYPAELETYGLVFIAICITCFVCGTKCSGRFPRSNLKKDQKLTFCTIYRYFKYSFCKLFFERVLLDVIIQPAHFLISSQSCVVGSLTALIYKVKKKIRTQIK